MSAILFVTATDTGVGKSLMAGLLLVHLQRAGVNVRAMKPFCCGGREDVDLLCRLQDGEMRPEEVSPFQFAEPLAPLVAARRQRRTIRLGETTRAVRRRERGAERLIVEGCGGVLVPLGKGFTVADLIMKLACDVVLVAPNKLGTINQTLLSVEALRRRGNERIKVVLMGQQRPDASATSNGRVLREWLAPTPVFLVPYFGPGMHLAGAVRRDEKKIKKTLARIVDAGSFTPPAAKERVAREAFKKKPAKVGGAGRKAAKPQSRKAGRPEGRKA